MKVKYSLFAQSNFAKANQPFLITLFAQDLRPAGVQTLIDGKTHPLFRGVWAAFVNISWESNRFSLLETTVAFNSPYNNWKHFDPPTPQGFNNFGAFGGIDPSPFSSTLMQVGSFSVLPRLPAGVTGPLRTKISVTPSPQLEYETLVLGNPAASPPEDSEVSESEIVCSGASFYVVA